MGQKPLRINVESFGFLKMNPNHPCCNRWNFGRYPRIGFQNVSIQSSKVCLQCCLYAMQPTKAQRAKLHASGSPMSNPRTSLACLRFGFQTFCIRFWVPSFWCGVECYRVLCTEWGKKNWEPELVLGNPGKEVPEGCCSEWGCVGRKMDGEASVFVGGTEGLWEQGARKGWRWSASYLFGKVMFGTHFVNRGQSFWVVPRVPHMLSWKIRFQDVFGRETSERRQRNCPVQRDEAWADRSEVRWDRAGVPHPRTVVRSGQGKVKRLQKSLGKQTRRWSMSTTRGTKKRDAKKEKRILLRE